MGWKFQNGTQQFDILYVLSTFFCWDVLLTCVFESQVGFRHRFLNNGSLMPYYFFFFSSGALWFWNSAVVEPCSWEDMANMYGTDCITEDSLAHHSLVLREVQTMDCRMYHLHNIIYPILWFCMIISFWLGQSTFFLKIFYGHQLWPSVKRCLDFSAIFSFGL